MKKIFFGLFLALVSMTLVQVGCDLKATPASSVVPTVPSTNPIFSTFKSGLGNPFGITMDNSGNIYYAERNLGTIVKVSPLGVKTTVVTGLQRPYSVALDSNGNFYAKDSVPTPGHLIKIVHGVKTTISTQRHIIGIAIQNGRLYYASPRTNSVYSMTLGGGTETFVVGGFNRPHGIAFDHSGNLFVADTGNSNIVKVTNGVKSNFATGLSKPWGIAVDQVHGNIFVTEKNNGNLDMFTPQGAKTVLNTYNTPNGVATDGKGNVYVVDSGTGNIEQINFPVWP